MDTRGPLVSISMVLKHTYNVQYSNTNTDRKHNDGRKGELFYICWSTNGKNARKVEPTSPFLSPTGTLDTLTHPTHPTYTYNSKHINSLLSHDK